MFGAQLEPQGALHKAQIHTKLCKCYQKSKRQAPAIQACSRALELDPNLIEALLMVRCRELLGWLRADVGYISRLRSLSAMDVVRPCVIATSTHMMTLQ